MEFIFAGLILYMMLLPILINFVPEAGGKYKDVEFSPMMKKIIFILIIVVYFIIYFFLMGSGREDKTIEFLEQTTRETKVYINNYPVVNSNYLLKRLSRIKTENKNGGNAPLKSRKFTISIEDKDKHIKIILAQASYIKWEYFIYSPTLDNSGYSLGVIKNIFLNEPIILDRGNEVVEYSNMDELMNGLKYTLPRIRE